MGQEIIEGWFRAHFLFCLEIASCFDACLFGENACSHFPTRTVVLSKRCASVRLKMAGRDAII